MSPLVRIAGVAILVAAGLGALFGQGRLDDMARATARDEVSQAAADGRGNLRDALDVELQRMEARAVAASALPQVRALTSEPVNAATLRDAFQNEPWWQPFRDEFAAWQLLFGDPARDFTGGLPAMRTTALVDEVRERRSAFGVVQGPQTEPLAAAAAAIDVPQPNGSLPTIVLARRFDNGFLKPLASRAGGTLLLVSGKKPLAGAGSERDLATLTAMLPAEGEQAVAPDGSAAAAALPVGNAQLWVFTSGGPALQHAAAWEAPRKLALYGAAGLFGLVGLALLLWPRRAAVEAPLAAGTGRLPTTSGSAPRITPTDPFGTPASTPPPGSNSSGRVSLPTPPPGTGQGPLLLDATSISLASPVAFGRYSVVEPLGQGGMADVYLAVAFGAEGFRRTFVIKRLRPELSRNAEAVAQFIDEARLGASMVHSNIIPVYDFGKVGSEYYLATEYILGRDVFRVVTRSLEKRRRALEGPVVNLLLQETLKALGYAHARTDDKGAPIGLVHRDVSPSNVLLSSRGEVKLFDFGIVKAQGRVTQTQAGIVKGNPSLMPPEQARGLDVDGRTDLFALGLTAYFALTGAFLYRAPTPYELLVKAAHGPGPEELERLRALPAPFDAVLERALRISPGERFQDAAAFARALESAEVAAASDVSALMDELFGEDFRSEQQRFASAAPGPDSAVGT